MPIDAALAALAATQCGTFSRRQVLDLGGDDGLIRRRCRSGAWLRFRPGVHGYPTHPDTWDRRLWIVYLAAGLVAVVSHHTAAALYRYPGFPRADLHLLIPHPGHQCVAGATVHQTRFLPDHHWVLLAGRRTTTPARTLVELAGHVGRARLDRAYEHALLTTHLTTARMARCFNELLTPGRTGMVKLGTILDERGPGHVPAASELEVLLFAVAEAVGLRPQRQHPLPGDQRIVGCVDGALPEAKLLLEADGRRWHTRAADFARDAARDKAAARAGWDTLRFTWEELTGDPDDAQATLREVYDARRTLLAP